MKRPCSFCGGPDPSRNVRRPFGTVCRFCARYIDARSAELAGMMPPTLRSRVVDHFTWGTLRDDMENMVYADDGADPFEGVS